MRSGLLAIALVCCTAPRVMVEPPDASSDGASEAAMDAKPVCPKVYADGAVCSGRDEDGDCKPNDCDACPLVSDPLKGTVVASKPIGMVPEGSACAHPFAPFDTVRTRLFFEPFDDATRKVHALGKTAGDALAREDSQIALGVDVSAGTTWPFLTFSGLADQPGDAATVAIAVLQVQVGAALLLRVQQPGGPSDPVYEGYGCRVDSTLRIFHPFHTTKCTLFSCGEYQETGTPIPEDLAPDVRIGVRASVATVDGAAVVECELFDPAHPQTLLLARSGSAYVARKSFPAPVVESGSVGLASLNGRTVLEAIDVQVAH